MSSRKIGTKFALFGGTAVIAALAFTQAASAQSAQPAQPDSQSSRAAQDQQPIQTPPAQAAPADDSSAAGEEVVVTGSRIHSEFNSPSPIQIVNTEQARQAGINSVGAMVLGSSVAAGSFQIDSTISSAFVTDGGPGSETVSLRGLGANRTLVLLNGRRAGPAGTRGGVSAFDLNVVPLAIVDRVEILKDGASSIYGSDAVAGVVNIITNTHLDHGVFNLETTQPLLRGGDEISGDASWGHSWDRGHILGTLSFDHQTETTNSSRSYTNCAADYTFSLATGQRNDRTNPVTGRPACRQNVATGLVWLYDLSGEGQFPVEQGGGPIGPSFIQYDPTGKIGQFLPQTMLPTPITPGLGPTAPNANYFNVGFDRATDGAQNLNSPSERHASFLPDSRHYNFYGEGSYDVTDNVEAYAEVLLNRRETRTHGFRQIWTYLYSADAGDPFSQGWNGASFLSPTLTTDHDSASQIVNYERVVGGFRGDFNGWVSPIHWDIYGQDSISRGSYKQDVILQDAVYSSEGRSDFGTSGIFHANSLPRATASCAGLVTPVSHRPCVDVNWLAPSLLLGGNFTPEEQAFLFDTDTGHTTYVETSFEGSITTDVLSLPAGNVGLALGATYRRDSIRDVPGPITQSGNSWNLSSAGVTEGDDTTREAFGELNIPILKDAPLATGLDLVLSGRYTDVSSYGSNSTWKVGVNWRLTPEFMIRYTKGTSFRAPALFELYLAQETGFLRQDQVDPCIMIDQNLLLGNISQRVHDNCATDGIPGNYPGTGSGVTVVSSGGAGVLKAETSDAQVIGLVYTPSWAGLSVSLDYFEINVDNEVTRLGANQVVFGCYNSLSFPTDPLCSSFTRGIGGTPNLIDTVNTSFLNVNSQVNRGLDLTAQYRREFPFGDFNAQAQFTYQLKDTTELFEGVVQDLNGTEGEPRLVGNVDFSLTRGPLTVFWRVNYIGPTNDASLVAGSNPGADLRYIIKADEIFYHTVSAQVDFGNWQLLAGVANVFDQEPPRVTTAPAAGQTNIGPSLLSSQYDYIGRRFFARLSTRF